ncbi:hypothetical protein F5051DRAFT_417592 [Lentinula edodes]|nr:hypothetical protein F5051DRAFT_417592 [Lentinula edodes]
MNCRLILLLTGISTSPRLALSSNFLQRVLSIRRVQVKLRVSELSLLSAVNLKLPGVFFLGFSCFLADRHVYSGIESPTSPQHCRIDCSRVELLKMTFTYFVDVNDICHRYSLPASHSSGNFFVSL